MDETVHSSIVKPTLDTPFHIDFSWWRENDREWRVFLRGLIGDEQEARLSQMSGNELVDWVDPQTAEVKQIDALQYLLMTHYAKDDGEGVGTSLVESLFRVFLKNGNEPLSSTELGEILGRPSQTILRTLSGTRVYRGIRPVGA